MSLTIFSLTCLCFVELFFQPTISALSNDERNIQSDDITSLPDKFPSIIDQMKITVKRLRCPNGWKRVGGSCYYFSNITSISSDANYTCNQLYSNFSNLMQIRTAVELFYAGHVLSRNNLTSLMIDIDPRLIRDGKILKILIDNQSQWGQMKNQFFAVRDNYQILAKNIVDRLNSAGIQISRRARKVPKSSQNYELNNTITKNSSIIDEEYEYDNLDLSDEIDEFEQIENTTGICDEIHWNVLIDDNNSTTFILTKYNMANKIVCSFSDVEPHTKYPHVCEYVLDFCFANILCGTHGSCVNTLTSFKCSCSCLYGGLFCERLSEEGIEIIISCGFIGIVLSIIYGSRSFLLNNTVENHDQTQQSAQRIGSEEVGNGITNRPRTSVVIDKYQNFEEIAKKLRVPSSSPTETKRDYIRIIFLGILSLFVLILLYSMIVFRYIKLFDIDASGYGKSEKFENSTYHLVKECARIYNYQIGSLLFAPFACVLILYFSFLIKRKTCCLKGCDCRSGLLIPFNPFLIEHRLSIAAVFGILTYEVSMIFEGLLFSLGQKLEDGILNELFSRIATIFLVGLQYYPVLASLNLKNTIARFCICLYMIGSITYTIAREGSCMGFLPLAGQHLEEAKLRRELGTWFVVYGIIKNTPHFVFLSFIVAELCVRFAYDSIYMRKKEKTRNIQPVLNTPTNMLEIATPTIPALLRFDYPITRTISQQNANTNNPNNAENEEPNKPKRSCFKKLLDSIYIWDDNFRFSVMIVSTYTIAAVFLFYLACTFVFLYLSRITTLIAFIKFYIQLSTNIELRTYSFKFELIATAVLTVIIYGIQLFLGMKQFRKDKQEPSKISKKKKSKKKDSNSGSFVADSIHFPGLLIGYMAWGFVICFHLILFIFILIRITILQVAHIVTIMKVIVPIVVLYGLKKVIIKIIGEYLSISREKQQQKNNPYRMNDPGSYAIYIYFILFADCFLGIASCIFRLIGAALANVLCMGRLDYSFFGRPFTKYDDGYVAYMSYLRMEQNVTYRIMLAFNLSCLNEIHKPPRIYYDQECCTSKNDDDDDVLKQEFLAAEKKKPTSKAKEMLTADSVKDDVPKQKEFIKNKTSNEFNSSLEEDEDRGRRVKTHNTIKKINRSKQPILDNPKVKDESSYDGSAGQASKSLKGASPISVGIFYQKAPKRYFNIRSTQLEKTTDKNQDDTVPAEEECDVQTTTDSSPSNTPKSYINKTYFAPAMLYREVQQCAPLLLHPSSDNIVPLYDENNTNDHECHYYEIRNVTKPSDINHPVGSIMDSVESLSDHFNLPQILTKKNHPKSVEEKERIKKRKRARTRWYLAFTLIHNRSLIKLRKKKTDALEQTSQSQRQSQAITHGMQSETLRSHKTKAKKTKFSKAPIATVLGLLRIPRIDDNSRKPAVRHIPLHSQKSFDANPEQSIIFPNVPIQETSTTKILQQENVNLSIRRTQEGLVNA